MRSLSASGAPHSAPCKSKPCSSCSLVLFFSMWLLIQAQTVITLAGGNTSGNISGSDNGVGSAALFNGPRSVSVDSVGNVFVADTLNHKIRLIAPGQAVTTFVGGSTTGIASGSVNGVGTAALFSNPTGVCVDSVGNVYVADRGNNKIRLIYPNLAVITIAGGSTTGSLAGLSNGVGTNALFSSPNSISVDSIGNVFVTDASYSKIRLIYPNQSVITLAGGGTTGTTSGSVNGVGTAALFSSPNGVSVDGIGNAYVADFNNHKIRLIYANLTVVTLAGGGTTGTSGGSINGVGSAALFNNPTGVSVDVKGNVYVADNSNNKIRLIYPFSCLPGTFTNFSSRQCVMCPPGSFSNSLSASSCSLCPGGTFTTLYGSSACSTCPGGHFCPPGTVIWAHLNCGRGNFCPAGSATPMPCPLEVPTSGGSWASTPQQAQGPAFLSETAGCRNLCFWNFSNGGGLLSSC